MLAGSLASSPYIAYTATEYSVLGDSPSSRTSGWATFTCNKEPPWGTLQLWGHPLTPSAEQNLTEAQAKVPFVSLVTLAHSERCFIVLRASLLPFPRDTKHIWGSHHFLPPMFAEVSMSYTEMLLFWWIWSYLK